MKLRQEIKQRQKDIIQKQCDFVEKLEADYGKLVEENAELKEERENMEREILSLNVELLAWKEGDKKKELFHRHIVENEKKLTKLATANSFAKRVKMAFYYHFDELIPSIMADEIAKIYEEITGEKYEDE